MNEQVISRFVAELCEAYPGAQVLRDGGVVCVKPGVRDFPDGCKPASTEVLVRLQASEQAPRVFVRNKPTTPGGVIPRNVNPEIVAGESWFGFSFSLVWDPERNTAEQFLEGALRRFAKNE